MKQCCACKKILQRTEFRVDKYNLDGLSYHCKKCKREKDKKWRENNKDKIKEINYNNREKRKKYYGCEKTKI